MARAGKALASTRKTLRAWGLVGWLVGDAHAATRQAIEDAATAVDVARVDGNAYNLARSVASWEGLLTKNAPPRVEVTHDGFDAFLATLGPSEVR
jgi:hypothetical protein